MHCTTCDGTGSMDSGGSQPDGEPILHDCPHCLGTGFAFAADAARLLVSESDRIDREAWGVGTIEQSMEAEAECRIQEYAKLIARAFEEEARRRQP